MTIWIDLANSPHVTFMRPFIKRFEKDGVPVVITARDYGNTIELLQQERWIFREVGGHGGKKTLSKMLSFVDRLRLLQRVLREVGPKVSFSQSSFYSPMVASSLRIPFVYTNDNEHAKGNLTARLPGGVAIYPDAFRDSKQARFFVGDNSAFYQGVKEAIYLSQSSRVSPSSSGEKVYFYRPEPWLAQYHEPRPEFSLTIIAALREIGEVKVIARDAAQRKYYSSALEGQRNVEILQTVVSLDDIVSTGAAFIGSGGTMCRELALLGVPTVSLYSGKLLAVDLELIKRGLLLHTQDAAELQMFLEDPSVKRRNREVAQELLGYGATTFEMFCERIYGFL
ncbi:MAG: DUF354 domain-containing protein [Candidatus Accumulibacter similis]|nr:MAG: DUF354 domain-containing protein [Candidatus Accumulibacter similis]